MMLTGPEDRPLGVQLLGRESYYILRALEKLKSHTYDVLDLNAACPQKKVTSRGKGAALLKYPKELQKLLAVIVKETDVPVTVKMRLGWDNDKDAVDIARHAEDAGVKAVFVHGRTVADGYRGAVNYPAIRRIKSAINIPVIGSGNIWSGEMAKKMFDETGCDSITVARGALGNPWIFDEIGKFLATGKIVPRPSAKQVARMMKYHLDLYVEFYGERPGVIRFRKFYIWYTRGFPRTKALRSSVSSASNSRQMAGLIEKFVAVADDES